MGAGASSEGSTIKQEKPTPSVQASPDRLKHKCPSFSEEHRTPIRSSSMAHAETPFSTVADPQIVCDWEFQDAPGQWRHFGSDVSERLEAAFVSGKPGESILVSGRLASVCFSTMIERLGTGGVTRRVRRCAKAAAEDTPALLRTHSSMRQTSDPFSTLNAVSIDALVSDVTDTAAFKPQLVSKIEAHDSPVYGLMFSSSGDKCVTGAKDGTCKFWELQTSYLVREFEQHPGSILSCALSPVNEKIIATGCDDCHARIFTTDSSEAKYVLEGHEHKVYAVNFTCDGKQLCTISMDTFLRVWDVNEGVCVKSVCAHSSSIFNLKTSSITPWLAITAGDDTHLVAHDLRLQNTVTHRFQGHQKTLWSCDIRFDDSQYISCGMDSKVLLWDPRNPAEPIQTISSHKHAVHCVEYLPDGSTFLSSARDRSFRLTTTETGKEIFSCDAHNGNVYKVTFNAATELAMSCGSDALVKLWRLPRLGDL